MDMYGEVSCESLVPGQMVEPKARLTELCEGEGERKGAESDDVKDERSTNGR